MALEPRRAIWVACVTLALAVPAMPNTSTEAIPPGDEAETFKVKLLNVTTDYGSERWKLDSRFYAGNPAAGVANGSASWEAAVGYRVVLKVRLTNDDGGDTTTTDLQNINITAFLQTATGQLRAYILREAGGPTPLQSNSPNFHLFFDLDGSNYAPPGGRSTSGQSPGSKYVHVDIERKPVTPGGQAVNVGSTDLVFDYGIPSQSVAIPGILDANIVDVPDTSFRLFNDIGWGKSVRMVMQPVDPAKNVQVAYSFGAPNATVKWWSLAAVRLCQPPACTPGSGGGAVEIVRKLLDTGRTDARGQVTFTAPAGDLLRFSGRTFNNGLAVVAASLAPEEDLGATLGDSFRYGSTQIRTGATELVVPVTNQITSLVEFRVENVTTSGQAPDPLTAQAMATNRLRVVLFDDGGGSTTGDAQAILPNQRDTGVLATGRFNPDSDPAFREKYRVAQVQAKGILDQHVTSYRVLALMYASPNDEFYGLTYADRGFRLDANAPPTPVGQSGALWLNVTSVTTNYDLRPRETGFNINVDVRVSIPDLRINRTERFSLAEAANENRPFPITYNQVGDLKITILSSSGDTLSNPQSIFAAFIQEEPKRKLAERIPGFEMLWLALGLAGFLAARRHGA